MKSGVKMIQLKKKPLNNPVKLIAKKKVMNKPAVGLAQLTESSSDLIADNLLQTQEQVHTKSESLVDNEEALND